MGVNSMGRKFSMVMGMAGMAMTVAFHGVGLAGPAPYSPEEPFIAGVKPYERPAGAPVIREYDKDDAWYARALTGISEPYPYSLRFLEDQGAWFNPFLHPGMPPPYDLRGWHAAKVKAAVKKPGKGKKKRKKKSRKGKRKK